MLSSATHQGLLLNFLAAVCVGSSLAHVFWCFGLRCAWATDLGTGLCVGTGLDWDSSSCGRFAAVSGLDPVRGLRQLNH